MILFDKLLKNKLLFLDLFFLDFIKYTVTRCHLLYDYKFTNGYFIKSFKKYYELKKNFEKIVCLFWSVCQQRVRYNYLTLWVYGLDLKNGVMYKYLIND